MLKRASCKIMSKPLFLQSYLAKQVSVLQKHAPPVQPAGRVLCSLNEDALLNRLAVHNFLQLGGEVLQAHSA